jgi:hypothetical protein
MVLTLLLVNMPMRKSNIKDTRTPCVASSYLHVLELNNPLTRLHLQAIQLRELSPRAHHGFYVQLVVLGVELGLGGETHVRHVLG